MTKNKQAQVTNPEEAPQASGTIPVKVGPCCSILYRGVQYTAGQVVPCKPEDEAAVLAALKPPLPPAEPTTEGEG